MIDNYEDYAARQAEVERRFRALRSGCQTNCSYDLRFAPSILSLIIRGKLIDEKRLAEIEKWLDAHEDEWSFKRRVAVV